MFTGLIREIANVKSYTNNTLSLIAKHKVNLGDSIAVNGVCLTVTKTYNDGFAVELAHETRSIIDIQRFQSKVHIEPAMKMGERFEGHIVQGHIDCLGIVKSITKKENGADYIIHVPQRYIAYIVPKGSIAIDGVSLTVNSVFDDSFRLTIIPHTTNQTLIGGYKIGTKVHIETDFFARYIAHILNHKSKDKSLSWADIEQMHALY
ncbi:MAG TPA: riboflavin synthase [Epsilonproteobacteria bacterium]|nr:riboflavin synthase [Campylobacterota bacterium]